MFTIESNAESVLLNLRQSIVRTEQQMEENLRRAGVDSVAIIAHRIQQQGESVSGRLQTKSLLRMGAYSKAHAKRRAEKGRQIAMVDLTMTGDTMRNWQVLATSPTEAIVGFMNNESAEIAAHLEEQYGEPIFSLSDKEQDFVVEGVKDRFLDDLRY